MPRTVDEIVAHAEQFAQRFENYEPRKGDEADAAVIAELKAAITERAQAEQHVVDAVSNARVMGLSWATIGVFVGTTGEAARQRYGGMCG